MSTAMSYQPKADEIKALREETSAPMMDCRKALVEAAGDVTKAKNCCYSHAAQATGRKEGRARCQRRHGGQLRSRRRERSACSSRLNSETDFVARNPKFAELARDIAMHIAAMSPQYLDRASVPAEVVDQARTEFRAAVPARGKSPEVAVAHRRRQAEQVVTRSTCLARPSLR